MDITQKCNKPLPKQESLWDRNSYQPSIDQLK